MSRSILAWTLILFTSGMPAGAETLPNSKSRDEAAVAEVKAGSRTEASAAWWGFIPEDSTDFLQAALDSGVKKLVIPFMGEPWIVRPLMVPGNIEINFEPGVLVLAKRGEFKGGGDSLFRATDVENIAFRGYGATLRMHKKDYQNPPYAKAEWRMGLAITGCTNVLVEGLRIESSGGDGIYIGNATLPYCKDVVIRDVVCFDNHRQGISVIGAENLLIENSEFSNTWGTPPSAGIDLEPDGPTERLVNCVIRNCKFENNAGHAMLVYLKNLDATAQPVSVRFENCVARMGYGAGMTPADFKDPEMQGWAGMSVGAARDNGPKGTVEFVNCVSENTGKEGAKVYDMAIDAVKVRFENCSWRNPWLAPYRDYPWMRVPIMIELRRPQVASTAGNVEFLNCHVYDSIARPVLAFMEHNAGEHGVSNLSGDITLHAPEGLQASMKLGPKTENISLALHTGAPLAPATEHVPTADAE